jgi:hypothetical protein
LGLLLVISIKWNYAFGLALGIKGVQEFAEIAYSQGKTFGGRAEGKWVKEVAIQLLKGRNL